MSDNWIVQNLENALNTWNEKLSEIWTLITQSPETFMLILVGSVKMADRIVREMMGL